jgi:hypothetical protein
MSNFTNDVGVALNYLSRYIVRNVLFWDKDSIIFLRNFSVFLV